MGVHVIPVSTAVQCGVPSTMVISQLGQASGPTVPGGTSISPQAHVPSTKPNEEVRKMLRSAIACVVYL